MIDNPPPGTPSRRPATRGEKAFGFFAGYIVLVVGGVFLLAKLTGSVAIAAIGALLLFSSAPAMLRLLSPKTKEELAGEVTKEEISETGYLRSIVSIKDKIAKLESGRGNEKEVWKLHRHVARMYDGAFVQSWANFDRISDGNLDLLAKKKEELIWARDHADNDKDRQWAEKNLECQRKKIDKWRVRAAKIIANRALLQKINRNYSPIIKKHYPASGFNPEDYLKRLNKAFPD